MTLKVLGPAGGREAFDAAMAAGADEIYMGLSGYGARRYAANFSVDEYVKALADAHKLGVELSLTLNTIMSESELETVTPDLDRLVEAGLDSLIVQDWGVIRYLRRRYPSLSLHASTQMALGSSREVQFAAKSGMTRVVLPRELSFDEMASIRKMVPEIELEVFCSGALCLGCSGKCYLSSYIGGRSGNRGSCAQPCRQPYTIRNANKNSEGKYLLSLRDQLMDESDIKHLAEIGIDVIKIEGRMKSAAYVFETVNYYRHLTDAVQSKKEIQGEPLNGNRVKRLFNRGYGEGFTRSHDPDILNPRYASHFGFPIGDVRNGKIYLSAPIVHGDGVVYLDDELRKLDGTNVSLIRLQPKLYGDREKRVPAATAGDVILLDSPPPAGGRYLYKTSDFELQKETAHLIKQTHRQRPIDLQLTVKIGKPLRLTLTLPLTNSEGKESLSVTEESSQLLEKSLKQRLDHDLLLKAADRFGNTSFTLRQADFDFDIDTFLPKSLLNQIRQNAVEKLEMKLDSLQNKSGSMINFQVSLREEIPTNHTDRSPLHGPLYSAAVRTLAQGLTAYRNGITRIYRYPAPVRFEDNASDPSLEAELCSGNPNDLPFEIHPLAGNLTEAIFYQERKIPFAADASFNIGSIGSALFLLDQFPLLTTLFLSNELSKDTVAKLGEKLIPILAERGGTIGLSVYGHPTGMYTRKKLFDQRKTEIENKDGRRLTILRNSDLYSERKGTEPLEGSSVFYGPPNDIIDETRPFKNGWELRADFTIDTSSEIDRALSRLLGKSGEKRIGFGYGFDHPIF